MESGEERRRELSSERRAPIGEEKRGELREDHLPAHQSQLDRLSTTGILKAMDDM